MRILFCGTDFPDAPDFLRRRLSPESKHEIVISSGGDVKKMLPGVDVIVPKMQPIDRPLIEAGTFRLIQQWGAGLEGIDLDAARARKIWVSNVPATGGNAESVAEHAILLMLCLLRKMRSAESNVRFGILGSPLGNVLAGRTVCLYGLGGIALAIAKRLRSWDVRLIGITRDLTAPKVGEFGLDRCFTVDERDRALGQTDVLILCLRYSEQLRDTIGEHELGRLPKGAYLVNVARGGLVNYEALHKVLFCERLAGAASDVFWREPIGVDDPILKLPNFIATPHIAGVTHASFSAIAQTVALNIERVGRGEAPLNCVM